VDAKEPDAGPLGPVSSSVLREIELALPPQVPLGVALGDARAPDELARMLDRLAPPARAGGTFLKVGFAGVSRVEGVSAVLRRGGRSRPRARPVGRGDCRVVRRLRSSAGPISRRHPGRRRRRPGAAGVLIDTWIKDGRGLLRHLSADALAAWVIRARRAGLLTALAGSLTADDLKVLRDIEPDVVGVRGAVCRGGRAGTIDLVRLQSAPRATLDRPPGRLAYPPPVANCQTQALICRRSNANDAIVDGHGSCLRSAEATSVAVLWV
jgi:uncharacterized protein (UPF0264 family)